MRYTGPKNRLARREGVDLGLKTVGSKSHGDLLKKLNIVPGQHGKNLRRKITDYGVQLRSKQTLKRMYGLNERQLRKYYDMASKTEGNTAELLVHFLERRLDNVIFRMGIAPTRASARQLVSHGHVTINNKKVTIPSYLVSVGEETGCKDDTTKIPYIIESTQRKEYVLPKWLDRKGFVGKIKDMPSLESFTDEVNLQYVVEFYSR